MISQKEEKKQSSENPSLLLRGTFTPNNETNDTYDNSSPLSQGKNIRNRMNSFCIRRPPKLYLDENEDILINISKNQRKMSDYSEESDSLSFSGRDNILEWCHNILDTINLTKTEKTSIFHRFCTAYDFIMEKLFLINSSIKEQDELKIFIITIFLLTYKLEGFSIAKITISNLIDAFLSALQINKEDLSEKILHYEMKIIELIDFNPQVFDDNNIYQLSYILWDLFKKKYSSKLKEGEEEKIEDAMNYINDSIEFSEKMIFILLPIDKAMISFYSAAHYVGCINKEVMISLAEFHLYLRQNMNVLKISEECLDSYAFFFHDRLQSQGI